MEPLISLVQRAQAGDVEAFTSMVERFQDMAYGYAYAFLNDFPLAQDVAQEAFIEAYLYLPDLRQPAAFPAWFKRILFKHCDRLTRGKAIQAQPLENAAELASSLPGPGQVAEQHELAQQIRAAILGLPLDQRIATTLYYINGYSQQEIASFLEVPAKTVKSRLHSSRLKLKERMMEMVEDELKKNPLSDQFTRDTVEKALRQAHDLNQDQKYGEAEVILRDILSHDPGHLEALKELNRAVARGKVLMGRWDLLPELVQRGQAILKAGEDEKTRRELAKTLLAIPAMPQAADFIAQWIQASGPNLERLGMLAWAKSCQGDFSGGEARWQEVLRLAESIQADEDYQRLAFITMTLVDAFSSAKEMDRAQQIARQGWSASRAIDYLSKMSIRDLLQWINTFHQAGLDYREIARTCLTGMASLPGLEKRGKELCIRVYLDDLQKVEQDWLAWATDCIAAQDWRWLKDLCHPILWSMRLLRAPDILLELAQKTWELLQAAPMAETAGLRELWNQERFNLFTYYDRGDWESLERAAWRAIREWKLDENANGLIVAAAARGKPTPVELIRAAEEGGVESVDSYGLFGWYMLAREAAAAGNENKAFEALRRSLGYWSNPPYADMEIWEQDARWGKLRTHPEFKRIFEEKRQRIGPIYGILHYFPDW
jgi:RNA polymerase sigma factor (sigma-70 family)